MKRLKNCAGSLLCVQSTKMSAVSSVSSASSGISFGTL